MALSPKTPLSTPTGGLGRHEIATIIGSMEDYAKTMGISEQVTKTLEGVGLDVPLSEEGSSLPRVLPDYMVGQLGETDPKGWDPNKEIGRSWI